MAGKKSLSRSEISQYAKDLIESMQSQEGTRVFLKRLLEEAAGTRRDVLVEAATRIVKFSRALDPELVTEMLLPMIDLGVQQKQDFIESYYRGLFECALRFPADNSPIPCKKVFVGLVTNENTEQTPLVSSAVLVSLASSEGLQRGLAASLADKALHSRLSGSFDTWAPLVADQLAYGSPGAWLAPDALTGFLIIVASRQVVPSVVRLALPVIVGLTGSVPEEFSASPHAKTEQTIRKACMNSGKPDIQQATDQASGAVTQVMESLPPSLFTKAETVKFIDQIGLLLQDLGKGLEQRIENMQAENKKLADANRSLQSEFESMRETASSLELKQFQLKEEVQDRIDEGTVLKAELAQAQEDLAQYVKSHDAFADSADDIKRDIVDRVKRDFAEHAGDALADVRHDLEELQAKPERESLRHVVINFNRLVRILHNQKFVSPDKVAKLADVDPVGGGS